MIWKDNSLYVGLFLALREIKRTNPATTLLIIFVMTLTFFNMNLIGGVLVGIAQGVVGYYRQYYSSDIVITPATHKNNIHDTSNVMTVIKSLPSLKAASVRYTAPALVEYGYKNKLRSTDLPETAAATLTGINPIDENKVTKLAGALVAGSYLNPTDAKGVLIGSSLIQKYATLRGAANNIGSKVLRTPDVGSKVRVTVNGIRHEAIIRGIISTNGTNIDDRIFMNDTTARELLKNTDLNADEIAIALTPNSSPDEAKKYVAKNLKYDSDILIQTSKEALPGGIVDVIRTFTILGNIVGGIALIVGAITIFIVIFVNAVTRRKYIGILKGIGISSRAIEFSYILLAVFYAASGIIIAGVLSLWLIVPYFQFHPIKYPIATGSLAITQYDIYLRGTIMILTSIISGFIPAWLVTKQNTLDSILGR
jgi:putative ABC transport system permease protein